MTLAIYLLITFAFVGVLAYFLWKFLHTKLKLRGQMLVTCPETGNRTCVELDSTYAALTSTMGKESFTLRDCARWPENANCAQECLREIEAAPEDCLARTLLTNWYQNKTCVFCHKPFGEIHWHDHKPALLTPDGKTVEWSQVSVAELDMILFDHRPVCWNCHVTELLRQTRPELLTRRPIRRGHTV